MSAKTIKWEPPNRDVKLSLRSYLPSYRGGEKEKRGKCRIEKEKDGFI